MTLKFRTRGHRVAAVLAALMFWPGAAAAQRDLSGVYNCEGVDASGEPYRVVVDIARHDEQYMVRWITPQGVWGIGVGVTQGDALAVTFHTRRSAGVALYRIEEGPALVGRWTGFDGSGEVYTERLEKLTPSSEQGAPRAPAPAPPEQPHSGSGELGERSWQVADAARAIRADDSPVF